LLDETDTLEADVEEEEEATPPLIITLDGDGTGVVGLE